MSQGTDDNLTFSSHARQSRRPEKVRAKGKGLCVHNPDDTLTQRYPGAWEDYLYGKKTTTVGYFQIRTIHIELKSILIPNIYQFYEKKRVLVRNALRN